MTLSILFIQKPATDRSTHDQSQLGVRDARVVIVLLVKSFNDLAFGMSIVVPLLAGNLIIDEGSQIEAVAFSK